MQTHPPIIIIKKSNKHAVHHGGAWKVAYADFVTAMMALFIVLWLMNASKQVQEAVGGYFKDPRGTSRRVGTNQVGSDMYVPIRKQDMTKLKEDLLRSIHHLDPHDKFKNQIEITITSEGLRIELIESPKGTFFELGSACSGRSQPNWVSSRITFLSRVTQTRRCTRIGGGTTTGTFQPIEPTKPGA